MNFLEQMHYFPVLTRISYNNKFIPDLRLRMAAINELESPRKYIDMVYHLAREGNLPRETAERHVRFFLNRRRLDFNREFEVK